MQITRAILEEHREQCSSQLAAYTGMIQFIEELVETLDRPEPEPDALTEQELAESVAGDGAKVESITPTKRTDK